MLASASAEADNKEDAEESSSEAESSDDNSESEPSDESESIDGEDDEEDEVLIYQVNRLTNILSRNKYECL